MVITHEAYVCLPCQAVVDPSWSGSKNVSSLYAVLKSKNELEIERERERSLKIRKTVSQRT